MCIPQNIGKVARRRQLTKMRSETTNMCGMLVRTALANFKVNDIIFCNHKCTKHCI